MSNVLVFRVYRDGRLVVARVAHVLLSFLWIGGVGMVTTVLLPAIRRSYPAEQRFGIFHAMEAGFARQARVTTVITESAAFTRGGWTPGPDSKRERFLVDARYGANMVVFTAMLFVIEPLFLERLLAPVPRRRPGQPTGALNGCTGVCSF